MSVQSSNIHPYDTNSDVYNFFFHPLHFDNVAINIVAVVTNIALSLFGGLWQIPFWIVNRLDQHNNPKTNILHDMNTGRKPIILENDFNSLTKPIAEKFIAEFPAYRDFKKNALALLSSKTNDLSKATDIDNLQFTKHHKEILKDGSVSTLLKERDKGNVEIISWLKWAVIAFTDLPGVVFKMRLKNSDWYYGDGIPCAGQFPLDQGPFQDFMIDTMGEFEYGNTVAQEVVKNNSLYTLYAPKAKFIPVDDKGSTMVQERIDCPNPTWQDQDKIYRYMQSDPELTEYADVVLKQLIFFTVVIGFGNTKYDKIPILPNGLVALHDIEEGALGGVVKNRSEHFEGAMPGIYGLYCSGCYKERGIFDHIVPSKRKELRAYAVSVAKQYCPNDFQRLEEYLKEFYEE